jgi:hypothetical protein
MFFSSKVPSVLLELLLLFVARSTADLTTQQQSTVEVNRLCCGKGMILSKSKM